MKMKRLGIFAAVAALATFLCIATAYSQDDIVQLDDPAFNGGQRPPAVFAHDLHNEKAEIDDCAACHHVYENGQRVEGQDSVGTSCSECHELKNKGSQPGLMLAYHKQCKTCHEEKGKGPVACGECHTGK
ncbi:cytochrome c553 [Desulfobaculum xiamenense]|uniref:Cytochrome c553 n=1 Tax=Desulfobaculum xiamenense TaxID=995050 RepID=A0A846QWN3_9BACT|nr:cytochrome c3 family protein [Desulfobaculum xiamenense]NJB69524.1 cytochrome c553 [Desulfobaculum xiamenense]